MVRFQEALMRVSPGASASKMVWMYSPAELKTVMLIRPLTGINQEKLTTPGWDTWFLSTRKNGGGIVGVGVTVGVWVTVKLGVDVGDSVEVGEKVKVNVWVGVRVNVNVCVTVGVKVNVPESVAVAVCV